LAELKDKVQNALDEGRMLILGAQLLLGFQLRAFLEKGFESLPFTSQLLKLLALGLILVAFALLVAPTAYHRIVERGEDSEEIHSYTTRVMTFALLPFALALGLDIYVAATKIAGTTIGALLGVFASFAALFFWYGLEVAPRGGGRAYRPKREARDLIKVGEQPEAAGEKKDEQGTPIKDKIRHVLTEARMVLPGVQALLGFQLIATLMEGFDRLPALSKYLHLGSMVFITLAAVLLMTPAAYHRIVERGEETEHFHRFAGRLVLAAMAALALGICGEIFIVVNKVLNSLLVSIVALVVTLAVFYELWFGLTVYRRTQRDHEKPKTGSPGLFGASL
jgi:DMSO reductase anchor subunit